jgi:cytochrome c5
MGTDYLRRETALGFRTGWAFVSLALSAILSVWFSTQWTAAEEPAEAKLAGQHIYEQKCARCHGAHGEGTADHYPKVLAGTKSVAELAALIEKTMPEDEPQACVGEEALRVAQYIYDAFYSPIAQARIAPPRVSLARLTVNQYRMALADLVASFQPAIRWDDQRGLSAEYYDGRGFRRDGRKLRRVDPLVDWEFGESSPVEGQIGKEEFAIRWQGGLWVPETGEYEFLVETDNAVRLWVNHPRVPLIDRWVRSGNDTLHRGTLFLLGGHVYPLRLEFMKSKEKTARVRLLWKMPGQVPTPIPTTFLSPHDYSPVFVVTTPFPPDDRSMGYERGTSMSRQWQEAAWQASLEAAAYIAENIDSLARGISNSADRVEKLRAFCQRFVERAFRRPLSDSEKETFVNGPFVAEQDAVAAVKRCVLLTLQSPRFLYQELPPTNPGHEPYVRAARLALALWDSVPDETLWRAAQEGRLNDAEQLRAQAERMVSDLRTRAKLRRFLHQWLKLDYMNDIAKDTALFPGFGPELVSDLRMSLDLFIDDIVWGEEPDLRRLFLASYLYATPRMAAFYGWSWPDQTAPQGQVFAKIVLPEDQYAGVLSHPMLMSGFAYTTTSSPIHRGVFLARSVLGKFLKPPPEAVAPLAPDLHPNLTTRARVELQTSPAACQSCHAMINHLGFALENYDAVGRYRLLEKDQPVDASGHYLDPNGELVRFVGARQLAEYLAKSPEVASAFVGQLFHFTVQQPIRAYGPGKLDELTNFFQQNGWNVRRLLTEIAVGYAASGVSYIQEPTTEAASSSTTSR